MPDALETSEVTSYEVTLDSTALVLVDTPGFDDTEMSDFQILHAIAAWLEKSCEKGRRLNGLVYLHRITNTRMSGSGGPGPASIPANMWRGKLQECDPSNDVLEQD